uniref:Uncharacterized protein n=1 Tax=viral metagenome TaxID=1070528 RepID=A0A6C0BJ96_9ZZZZ
MAACFSLSSLSAGVSCFVILGKFNKIFGANIIGWTGWTDLLWKRPIN